MKSKRWLLAVLFLVVLTLACEPESDQPRLTEVWADQDWSKTSYFVPDGRTLWIEYESGKWSPWPGSSYDGLGAGGDPLVCNVLVGASHAALIGRVGRDGQPFLVGNHFEQKIAEGGSLYLRINDTCQGDNSGSLIVRVRIY
jgi:hypothetical protein